MSIRIGTALTAIIGLLAVTQVAAAADMRADMNRTTQAGPGEPVGDIVVAPGAGGTVLKLNLRGLPPGPHGFHVHENGACGPTTANGNPVPAGAAGGHWDTDHTGRHEGPHGQGHNGDLPVLDVATDGTATQSLTAPRIKDASQLKGHALVIHAGGDNYSDQPAALGGGGGRIACGVIS